MRNFIAFSFSVHSSQERHLFVIFRVVGVEEVKLVEVVVVVVVASVVVVVVVVVEVVIVVVVVT